MVKKGLVVVVIFLISGIQSFANTDTLRINSNFFHIPVKKASTTITYETELTDLDKHHFEFRELPLDSKQSIFLRKIIDFKGEFTTAVIFEPKGFHYIDLYLKDLYSGKEVLKRTGRLLGYPENELCMTNSQNNKVKFTLEPNHQYELLVHYKNPKHEIITIDLQISDAKTWNDILLMKMSSQNFWLGVFFGTLILLSLVNFIFYYLFKDRTYIVYVGYILTILVYEFSLYGYFDKTWMASLPIANLVLSNTALILVVIFYLLFIRAFLNLRETYPRWNTMLTYIIIFLVILLFSSDIVFILERPISGFTYRNLGLLLIIPIAIVFLSFVVFSKRLIDRVFFTGSIFLVISGFLSILVYFYGDVETSDLYLQVGILVELVIFNIGLGLRSKVIQNEKDEELHQLIIKLQESEEKQKALNTNLEEKVIDRTQKINEINQKLMSQRDQLFVQNETIEQNLKELNDVRKSLVQTVHQKTKELRQANKELVSQNAQLEQYAFITAHNLKAPVARLRGLVNIFELTNKATNPNNELISRIKEASIDMDEVISDINKILQIKNFNQQDRELIDIDSLITKIEARLKEIITDNKVIVRKDLQITRIKSIDAYLESILYNLIYNGIKYSRENTNSFIEIRSYKKGSRFNIEVIDNGIGIDLEQFGDKVFGLYQRFHDHVNGKGIGLYLVKTQVEALGGNISLESNVNDGTVFKISFPTLN